MEYEHNYKNKPVRDFWLRNDFLSVRLTNFGARIMSVLLPDKSGLIRDVVLGFDEVQDYFPENHLSDFGAVIGRYANRLQNGRILVDGCAYQLPKNDGPHCLHGGPDGWQYQPFEVLESNDHLLKMMLISPDGDNGFPGTVQLTVTYSLQHDNLSVLYEAESDGTTVLNVTNHSYFNLSGDGSKAVYEHLLMLRSEQFTPVNETLIPTGERRAVEGTAMDFRTAKPIGQDINADDEQLRFGKGYDHNWIVDGNLSKVTARLQCPETGITLEVRTTMPGVQLYTGNFLDGSVIGKGHTHYVQRGAVCLETQCYPDSPNQHFPESSGYLRGDERFESTTVYRFYVDL